MPIPDFQTIMRPLLAAHEDGEEHINRDLISELADQFELTEDERREMLPSGGARLFDNRVGWAKTHISQAGLLESPQRAVSVITERGRAVLQDHPERVDLRVLATFEDYREFRNRRKSPEERAQPEEEAPDTQTPEESLENAYQKVRRQIEAELLSLVMDNRPDFLERVVVDLVVRMGTAEVERTLGRRLAARVTKVSTELSKRIR